MLLKHLPLFFFSKGFSSQLCSVGLSVPVVYVAVSQHPSSLVSPCPPLPARPSLLAPPCSSLLARPSSLVSPCSPSPYPLVLSFLQLCMLLYHSNPLCSPLFAHPSLPAPLCPPLPARPSSLAPPCPPSGLSLSSLFPPVVYVAVLQQPSCRPCYGVLFLSLPVLYEKKFCSLEISE